MAKVASEQRRQSAVVSMDVVGYSTMIANDVDATVAAVKDCHQHVVTPLAARHRGRLGGRAGDSWLIEFASADAAMCFALQMQTRMAEAGRMRLRVGVNFGDVFADDTTLHGGGINIAVRLQEIARPGGIAFSAAIHSRLSGDLGCRYREMGPRVVKNIPEPVWVYRVVMKGEEDEAVASAASLIDVSRPVPGLGNRPAIAVLPFENAGQDRQYEYFSEGLADDVINGLSRFRWFPVISRNSSFRFRGGGMDAREIGRQLGVRYIVGGSVLLLDGRLRAKVWLTDAEQGHVIWSGRFDREARDVFAVQDEIAEGVVGSIEPELSRAEQFRSRTQKLESLNDWEMVRCGLWHMNRLTREDAGRARDLFDRALAANPASVEALVHLAWWHFWDVWAQRGPAQGWVEMARLARRAIALDPQDSRAAMLSGIAEFMQGELEYGRNMLKRAVQMNPNLAVAHASIGSCHILAGEPELALEPLQTAIRLSPNDFYVFHALGEMAVARYMMADYNLGIRAAEESLELRPGYFYAHIVRVGCLARLGRAEEAGAALDEFLARRPDFTIRDIEWLPFTDRHWVDYLAEGLARAGFQDCRQSGPDLFARPGASLRQQ